MSEQVMAAPNIGNTHKAKFVKVKEENGFDRIMSTWLGSNLALLFPIVFWLPVLVIVLVASAFHSIFALFKSDAPISPELKAKPNAKLQDLVTSLTVDDLVNRSREQLDQLFELGETPTIEEISGMTDGRVLLGSFWPINSLTNLKMVNLPFFPWKGKTFNPISKEAGCGRNRMEIGPLKILTFPFETLINPPLFGKNKVFTLNYTLSGNPLWARLIRDDMVRLKSGLYLGRANLKWGDGYIFLVYFTLRLKDY